MTVPSGLVDDSGNNLFQRFETALQQLRQQHQRDLAEVSRRQEEFQAAIRQEQLTHQQQTQASLATVQ